MQIAAFQEFIQGLVSLVYPPHCALCQLPLDSAAPHALCRRCATGLPLNPPPWCGGCGRSLAGLGVDVATCAGCREHPVGLVASRAACRYDGAAKACVLRLKYHAQLGLVVPMAERMAAVAQMAPGLLANALVPVPLASVRLRERTFNQAELLAEAVAPRLGLPVLARTLVRSRATDPQNQLDAAHRRRNVAGAFAVRHPAAIRGRSLVLIDDVVTTGATTSACARALREAGAASVSLLAFAHG